MLLSDFCIKIYFWPFLSYLANIKGLCPTLPPGFFPVYPIQPGFPLTPSPIVIPTFQPTPPSPQLPPSLPPFPTFPTFPTTFPTFPTTLSTTLQTCPTQPLVCLPGGARPIPNCPCIDPRQQQQQQQQQQQPLQQSIPTVLPTQPLGSDMMVFMPLNPNKRRRRRRRRRQSENCVFGSSRPGRCIGLAYCPNINEEFNVEANRTSVPMEFQTFLGAAICGFNGNEFLICCPLRRSTPSPTPITPQPQLPTQPSFLFASLNSSIKNENRVPNPGNEHVPSITTQPPTIYRPTPPPTIYRPTPPPTVYRPTPPTSRPNEDMKASPCGISTVAITRVVGGAEVGRGAFPWIAALAYNDDLDYDKLNFMCGGSLATSRYIITSAHCITPMLALVRLGAHNVSKSNELGALDFRIKRTIVHEKFDLKTFANDVALIELPTPAPSTNFIATICLPENVNFLAQDFVGYSPFVAGWGAVQHYSATSDVLRVVQVPIISRNFCEQNYRSVFKTFQFSDKLICAGNSLVDACQGDSGGPLMLPQLENGVNRFYLLGIVSFGYECSKPGFPGIYTRVAEFLPWLKKHLA